MQTQNGLFSKQDRWEIIKVLAAMAVGCAALFAASVGIANYLMPKQQPQYVFPPGTVITIPPAKP